MQKGWLVCVKVRTEQTLNLLHIMKDCYSISQGASLFLQDYNNEFVFFFCHIK